MSKDITYTEEELKAVSDGCKAISKYIKKQDKVFKHLDKKMKSKWESKIKEQKEVEDLRVELNDCMDKEIPV